MANIMSNLALLLNMVALAIYGYSAYHINSNNYKSEMRKILPPQLNVYAHFIKPLRRLRDLVFTTLAYPVGSIVVYTFWAVWIILGRELILPAKLDPFFPPWLNHSTHTIIAPINILMSILLHHRYIKAGFLLTLTYTGMYTVFLFVIKAQTGLFVYGYLEQFNDTERTIYFASTGFFAYFMYKTGQLLTYTFYGAGSRVEKQQVSSGKQSKKTKQK